MVAIGATLATAAVVPALVPRSRGGAAGAGASQRAVGTAAQAAAVRYWTGSQRAVRSAR